MILNEINPIYNCISEELERQILSDRREGWINPFACRNEDVIRRNETKDKGTILRPAFVRDCEKIIHLPYYNRYTDKTQVFSAYQNDDLSRRALHVQLVSRIARNIGKVLGLNCDLIEAMALGHDLGHTPFGHAGESFLSDILEKEVGAYFNHNIQSGRILDTLFLRNVSLQTLDGIICHNGELEQKEYRPNRNKNFDSLQEEMDQCSRHGSPAIKKLVPMTLEGCVVRISDMIAYLGKDRQDAVKSGLLPQDTRFSSSVIGESNAAIINNMVVDIIENSYGKDYLMLSQQVFEDLRQAKKENYQFIYLNKEVGKNYDAIKVMFDQIFERLLDDLKAGRKDSIIYRHHIDFISANQEHYNHNAIKPYIEEEPALIVADFMASMTDSYFEALYKRLFPQSNLKLEYVPYFHCDK